MTEMVKVVYNNCYGGFSLSDTACEMLRKMKAGTEYEKWDDWDFREIPRHDRDLVMVVELLGSKASGTYTDLAIDVVEKGQKYRIDEYDGREQVMTIDDYKWETA